MTRTRRIQKAGFQVVSPPAGNGVTVEFMDDQEEVFMEVNIDSSGVRHVVIFGSSENLSLPLSELRRGLEIAEKRVNNMNPDSLFPSQSDDAR